MTGSEAGTTTAPKPGLGIQISHVPPRILVLVFVIIALSGVVRLVDLGRFTVTLFDEHYYVYDANVFIDGDLNGSAEQPWKPASLRSAAHPDLGKLAIAAGILVFGNDGWGWRIPSALAGTALIALVFPLARRLGLTPEWSLGALLLAAADPMLMIESRLGVLDIFVALWTAVVVYLALRFVQSGFRSVWIVACGVALGAAVASKWSGLLAGLAVLVVVVPSLVRNGCARRTWIRVIVAVTIVPLGVYVLSSLPYFIAGHGLGDWLRLQWHMAGFGWGVHGDVSFASAPLTWPFDVHPIWYSWSLTQDGVVGLLAIGAPLLWWGAVVAWIVLAVLAVVRRDWRLGVAPSLVAVLYLPWLLTSRQTYIYYMVPVVPFMAITLATALARLSGAAWAPVVGHGLSDEGTTCGRESRGRRILAWALCLGCAAVGLAFLPFVLGVPVPFEYYDRLMLFTTWR